MNAIESNTDVQWHQEHIEHLLLEERKDRLTRAIEMLATMLENGKLVTIPTDADMTYQPVYTIDRAALSKFVEHNWSMISVCTHIISGSSQKSSNK